VKRIVTAAILALISNVSLYGMKRPASSDLSLQAPDKKREVDRHPSFMTDELRRGVIFCAFKVKMRLDESMPRQELDQFQKNFEDFGITGENKLGILLQQFYMASMNNIHAGSKAKLGGPDMYIVNDEIVFE
jgi:hypothetical protein